MTAQAWQGIAAEEVEEVTARLSALLRRRARRLLADLLRPHRRAVLATLVLIVTANLAALAGPWLVGVGIDRGIPPLARRGDVAPLAWIVAAYFAAVAVQALATRAFIVAIGRFGEGVVAELRRRLFLHFQRLPVAFHEHYTSGRVISRQTSDIDSLCDLFEEGLDSLVSAIFSLLLVGVGMLLLDWPLALVVLAGFAPLTVLTLWFRRESAAAYRRSRETIAAVIVHFVETFGGIRAVQAFRRERRNEEIFASLNERYAAASLRSSRLIAVYSPGITLIGNLATGAVLLYGGLRVADGDIKVGVLATFLLYLERFFHPLQDLSQFYNTFQSSAAALEKISGVLDEPLGVAEPETPAALPDHHGHAGAGPEREGRAGPGPHHDGRAGPGPHHDGRAGPGPHHDGRAGPGPHHDGRAGPGPHHDGAASGPAVGREIQFRGVRFGYREAVVLPGLDVTIPAGQTVALVGETGAGKTTIARLAARFYDPREGQILLDGVDLRDLPDATLRREVVLITQENFLFSGSIADNIEMGKPGASRAEIEAAAAAIGAHEFIARLSGGYDSPVGKRGGRLSAGQRQLISFARVFLAAPAVLVLDEATSLLDIPGERAVQAALRTILAGRTAIIIAHRLSTVAIADRVLVLSQGQIVEDGPPTRLLAGKGEFSALNASWRSTLA
jgi:ATP-binding cassette, subfamily B, bacterial